MGILELNLCWFVYYSSVFLELIDKDLDVILEEVIVGNELCGVIGLLVYDDFYFMQVLEGNEDVVNNFYFCIVQDFCYYDVKLIYYQKVEECYFQDWVMVLVKLFGVFGWYIDKFYGGFEL